MFLVTRNIVYVTENDIQANAKAIIIDILNLLGIGEGYRCIGELSMRNVSIRGVENLIYC